MAAKVRACARTLGTLIIVLGVAGATSHADLSSEFAGFETAWDVGVSGLTSSYHSDTKSGTVLPDYMHVLGPGRVEYPFDIGAVPSPGHHAPAIARIFDEGAIGVKVVGGDLVIRAAGGLDPQTGYYYHGRHTWYGQGDVFITVDDSAGISHYSLLSIWARDDMGNPRRIDGSVFDAAQAFHTQGGAGGTSLEGHLVGLSSNDDVVRTGGKGSYYPDYSPAPEGLDYRAFVQGGTDVGDAGLTHGSTWDTGLGDVNQKWYVQTWTLPMSWLSSDSVFTIGLHKTSSCGNDQLGMVTTVVPAPSALLLGGIGLSLIRWATKRRP